MVGDREQEARADHHRYGGDRVGELHSVRGVEPPAEEGTDEAPRPRDRVVETERAPPRGAADQSHQEERARRTDERPGDAKERVKEGEPREERGRPEAEENVDGAPQEQEHQQDAATEGFEEDRLRGVRVDGLSGVEEQGGGGRRRAEVDNEDPRVREPSVLPEE